jgi:hypothetical protein
MGAATSCCANYIRRGIWGATNDAALYWQRSSMDDNNLFSLTLNEDVLPWGK